MTQRANRAHSHTTRTGMMGALTALAIAAVSPIQAQDGLFAGPDSSLDSLSHGWSWDGTYLSEFRAAVENSSNFGPGGVVEGKITTTDLSTIDESTLADVCVFVSPWWATSESAPHHDTLIDWFLSGGNLFLLQDNVGRDGIGAALGIPTAGSGYRVPSSGDAPLFEGPFGSADGASQNGAIGILDPADVAANGGTVGSVNSYGQVTAAYWHPGDYAPGAGALVILADVDFIATRFGHVDYDPLDENGRLALNTAAFLLDACVVDTDGDGIPDDEDACIESDLSPTVVIDGGDSGVTNSLFNDGCTLSDLIAACAAEAENHGDFVSWVAHLTNDLKKDGILSGKEKGAIQKCAAKANLP